MGGGGFYADVMKRIKAAQLRNRYLREVNDPALRPKPRLPKPPRRERRGQSKPR